MNRRKEEEYDESGEEEYDESGEEEEDDDEEEEYDESGEDEMCENIPRPMETTGSMNHEFFRQIDSGFDGQPHVSVSNQCGFLQTKKGPTYPYYQTQTGYSKSSGKMF